MIAPESGSGYAPDAPPLLRWSIVPGAERYQVGFASEPFFSKIDQWYEVADTQWQVPAKVWSQLPEGELYWTVRAIELGKDSSRPAPMRRVWRVPAGALIAVPEQSPAQARATSLRWRPLSPQVIYRFTVFRDRDGKQIIRRALTTNSFIDLRDSIGSIQAGTIYYWQVEAFTSVGQRIFIGDRQTFFAGTGSSVVKGRSITAKSSNLLRANYKPIDERASLANALLLRNDSSEKPTLLRNRAPRSKQVVHETRPVITLEFRSRVAPSELSILLDNTEITAAAQVSERKATVKSLAPLENGPHRIEVTAGSQTESWEFVVDRGKISDSAPEAVGGSDAETEIETPINSAAVNTDGEPTAETNGSQANYELSSHSQWVSGNEVDNNLSTLAAQASIKRGPWRAEVSGTGLINSLFSTKPKHALGQFNDYVMRLAHDQKSWGTDVRFGTIAPQSFVGAEFMNTSYPRQAVEASVRTPGGIVSLYANAFDRGGQGQGEAFAFRQEVNGGSYQAPLPSERIGFRFTWLRARDTGASGNSDNAGSFPVFGGRRSGTSYDALFTLRLGKTWRLTSEFSSAANNLNTDLKDSDQHSGRAWRTLINGSLGKTVINLSFRNVSPDFANPVTASLGQLSTADRRGVDASLVSPTSLGLFSVSYQLLQSDVHSRERRPVTLNNLNWNWSKSFTSTTVVTVGGNLAHTGSGDQPQRETIPTFDIDQTRFALNSTIRQTVGRLALNVGGSRNWFFDANNKRMNNVTSALNVGGQLRLGSFFQLQTNFSVNWLAGDKFTFARTRTMSTYIQPVLNWSRIGLQISPLVTINQMKAVLGQELRLSDMLNAQYGGRVSWQMPGRLRFSTLSFEGTQSMALNRIQATELKTPRLLIVWTLIRSSKREE